MKTVIFFAILCFATLSHAEETKGWSFEVDGVTYEGSWPGESSAETQEPPPTKVEPSFYEKNKTAINTAAALAAAAVVYALFSDGEQCFDSDDTCSDTQKEHHTGLFETLGEEMRPFKTSVKSSICRDESDFRRFLKEAEITVFTGAGILTEMVIGGDGSLFGVYEDNVKTTIDAVELTKEMMEAGLC